MSHAFLAREHIRRRADFVAIYDHGWKAHGRLMTMFRRATALDTPRLGVSATRKLGGAVVRNRAKRLIRELFRHHKPSAGTDIVIVPRRELLDAPYAHAEAEFRALLGSRGSAQSRRRDRTRPRPRV